MNYAFSRAQVYSQTSPREPKLSSRFLIPYLCRVEKDQNPKAEVVGKVDVINNYEEYYVDVINFLRTGNLPVSISKQQILHFKCQCS